MKDNASLEMQKVQGAQRAKTYRAVEVSARDSLRVVERTIPDPGPGQVRIRVEARGICHTDAATVMGAYPGLTLPRVPGHEVVGRIEALGNGVSRWKIGQRVGVGLIAGEDGLCEPCRRGGMVNCQNPPQGSAHSRERDKPWLDRYSCDH
jgi:alcohol dehydrogenase, propanol-preferring